MQQLDASGGDHRRSCDVDPGLVGGYLQGQVGVFSDHSHTFDTKVAQTPGEMSLRFDVVVADDNIDATDFSRLLHERGVSVGRFLTEPQHYPFEWTVSKDVCLAEEPRRVMLDRKMGIYTP